MPNGGPPATFKVNFSHIDKKPPATEGNNTFSGPGPRELYFGGGVGWGGGNGDSCKMNENASRACDVNGLSGYQPGLFGDLTQ